jgi:hypothetical protein
MQVLGVWNVCFGIKWGESVFNEKDPVRKIFIYFIIFQHLVTLDVLLIRRGSLGVLLLVFLG